MSTESSQVCIPRFVKIKVLYILKVPSLQKIKVLKGLKGTYHAYS